jgi:hypothetical protein
MNLTVATLRLAVLLFLSGWSGCYSTSGTLSREPRAYLNIIGGGVSVTAAVDDLPTQTLVLSPKGQRLQVSPGKHRIRISRGNYTLVDRVILVSDDQTLEIEVP